MFLMLAYRLPAYSGAMAAAAACGSRRAAATRSRGPARYERGSAAANNARTADSAPVATAAALAGLNAQLGGGWFSVRQVKPGDTAADTRPDLRQVAHREYPELSPGRG